MILNVTSMLLSNVKFLKKISDLKKKSLIVKNAEKNSLRLLIVKCVMCYILLLLKESKKFYLLSKRVKAKTKRRARSYKCHIRDMFFY